LEWQVERQRLSRQLMDPGCLAHSTKRSTKWLPEYLPLVVYFDEIVVLEDYLYDKISGKFAKVSNVCNNVSSRRRHIDVVIHFTYLIVINVVGKGRDWRGLACNCDCDVSKSGHICFLKSIIIDYTDSSNGIMLLIFTYQLWSWNCLYVLIATYWIQANWLRHDLIMTS